MSLKDFTEIECPQCKHKQNQTIWESVNFTIEPDLETKLLNRELNQFVCEKCGYSAEIKKDLLVNNMEKGFMIQYIACEKEDFPKRLKAFKKSISNAVEGIESIMNIPTLSAKNRITDSLNSLIETLLILNHGLSDLLIFSVKKSIKEFPELEDIEEIYFNSMKDDEITFIGIKKNKKTVLFSLPQNILDDFPLEEIDLIENELIKDNWFYVSQESIEELRQEYKNYF